MRGIFLQNAKNNNEDIQKQVLDLNEIVIEYCVKNILVNLKQYLGYLEDIQEKVDYIPNPEPTNIKGDKNNYNLFKRNDEKIRLYGHTAAFGKALDVDKNFYFKDGRKIFIKSCDSDFLNDSQWKGHVKIDVNTLKKVPVVPKTNGLTKRSQDGKSYSFLLNGNIVVENIEEISCDDIDEEWCMNYGDIEFPQYDENGTEIFRQSSNDACSRCCVTRSKSAVDKAGSQDLSGFALATATGALKDKTKKNPACSFQNLLLTLKI